MIWKNMFSFVRFYVRQRSKQIKPHLIVRTRSFENEYTRV